MTQIPAKNSELKNGDKVQLILTAPGWRGCFSNLVKLTPADELTEDIFTVSKTPGGSIIIKAWYWKRLTVNDPWKKPYSKAEDWIIDERGYQVSKFEGVVTPAKPPPKPLVELPFEYTLNKPYWNDRLEQELIKKSQAAAESHIKRTMREWPWGKQLKHEVDKANDKIKFFWKD